MPTLRRLVPLPALALAVVAAAAAHADQRALLDARAHRTVSGPALPAAPNPLPPGLELFSMSATDNAVAVRDVPDVNGDQRDEVLVGIDQSGTPDVFLLDGASSGTADVLWSFQPDGGVSGGSPYGDECLVVASDADHNGAADLLVGTAWGGRTAYLLDSLAGAERWRYDTYLNPPDSGWIYSLAELGDSTGDGLPEVAFGAGSFSDSLYVVSGASSGPATLLWRYQAADAVHSVRNAGDLGGDANDDVVLAVTDNGHAIVALDGHPPGSTGVVLWTYPTGSPSAWGVGVMPDVTGDGRPDVLAVLWAIDGSSIRCLNGATGALVWQSTTVSDYGMLVDPIADVNGDGHQDVIVSSWDNSVQVLDGVTGAEVWKRTVGTLNGGDVWSARHVGDLNGDGFEDVVAGSFDGFVYALSGVNGWPFWAFDTGRRLYSVAGLGDLDGDGVPDVAAGTQNLSGSNVPVVHVLSGAGGGVLPLFADDFENGFPAGWSLTVAAPGARPQSR
jgi:hypothetical protein